MSPIFSRGRNLTRGYRYYLSTTLQQGRKPSALAVTCISAPALESLMLERMSR